MINVWIDEFTSCLKDTITGNMVDTEVIRIKRKSFLSKYNRKNGWYVNWKELLSEHEVYALVLKGSNDIEGLVALSPVEDYSAVYIAWMCVAPHNNKLIIDIPKYVGVGGHLFAIAAQRSEEMGFGGAMTGFAANLELVEHYIDCFNAEHIAALHPYQILIGELDAYKIREEYDYEWTDDEL